MIKIIFTKLHKCFRCAGTSCRLSSKLLISMIIIVFTLGSAVGCRSGDSSMKLQYFPVQNTRQPQLLALIEGKLVLEKGSLRVAHKFLFWQTDSHLIIWPFGYSWMSENNCIWVLNEKGEKVAKVGDSVKCGGGSIEPNVVKLYTGQEPPAGIQGPFWLLGDIHSQL